MILYALIGNLTTKPINGAIFVFNPRTGQLFLISMGRTEEIGSGELYTLYHVILVTSLL